MKIAETRRVAEEYVLPLVGEEVVPVGRLVVFPPLEWLVRAFAFGSSTSSRTDFFVHALVDPLHSPDDQAAGMAQTRSPRLIYEDGLDARQAGMLKTWLESEGMPLLRRIRSPGELADDIARRERGYPLNLERQEMRAYSLIVADRDDEARATLRFALDHYGQLNDLLDYEQKALERGRAMLERLDADRGAALEVLHEWRREKAPRAGLAELLAPLTD